LFYLNGIPIQFDNFPDGTVKTNIDYDECVNRYACNEIDWHYDGDHECIRLWYLVQYVRERSGCLDVILFLPYVPNARMDRTQELNEVFTLKYFCQFINSLNFSRVFVTDVHSNVTNALLNNVYELPGKAYEILETMCDDEADDLVICFPDEGALKRYARYYEGWDVVYGIKTRDWKTGKILTLQLSDPDAVSGKRVLIVDDICSRGGTFMLMAGLLREAGATDIRLYVTHCENTIHQGDILLTDYISHVYTTDSIYRGSHNKITVRRLLD